MSTTTTSINSALTPSPSTAAPSAATTSVSGGGGGGGPTSSPLLFFVALGFGVVFTNLWYAHTSISIASEKVGLMRTQDYCWRQILLPIQPAKSPSSTRREW